MRRAPSCGKRYSDKFQTSCRSLARWLCKQDLTRLLCIRQKVSLLPPALWRRGILTDLRLNSVSIPLDDMELEDRIHNIDILRNYFTHHPVNDESRWRHTRSICEKSARSEVASERSQSANVIDREAGLQKSCRAQNHC